MSPFSLIIVAFLVALPVMGFAFAGGAVIIALPVSIIGIAAIGMVEFTRQRKRATELREFRDQAKAQKVDFTERDRETIVPE
jgi:uncharacterized membrane protein